ncbi:MAG: DUF3416 domain-containing protein, partial [Bifidobacteriaceae bacterium]|nr:DUF3416 domain-containing protein [Bifidobacteriaceae bacterium]
MGAGSTVRTVNLPINFTRTPYRFAIGCTRRTNGPGGWGSPVGPHQAVQACARFWWVSTANSGTAGAGGQPTAKRPSKTPTVPDRPRRPKVPAARPQAAPPAPIGRVAVTHVGPAIEGGRWPARAVAGEPVPITATVFRDGHELAGATAVLQDPEGRVRQRAPMVPLGQGLDRWQAILTPSAPGAWTFAVEGWTDPIGSWRRDAEIKVPQGIDPDMVLGAGADLLTEAAGAKGLPRKEADSLRAVAAIVGDREADYCERLAAATGAEATEIVRRYPLRRDVTASAAYPLRVVRERALVGAWYEIFPRSIGARFAPGEGWVSGTLQTAAAGLDRIA